MKRKGPAYDAYLKWVDKLKEFRLNLDITQEEIASLIPYSRNRYGAIEKGESIASFLHLYNLAEAFGVTVPQLLALRIPKKEAKNRIKRKARKMARLRGMKVFVCNCGTQLVGFPGETKICAYCSNSTKIPDEQNVSSIGSKKKKKGKPKKGKQKKGKKKKRCVSQSA